MIPHVVLCLAYQRERMVYQYSSSNPYIALQWCRMPLVKFLVRSFHKWYRYSNARQYRGLMTNSGMPSFIVGTKDIGPHEVS